MKQKVLSKGRVLSILGEKAKILKDQNIYICSIRGILKKEKTSKKNILAVGDFVYFSKDGAIENIEKRFSILSRQTPIGNKEQIIASNIDQVFIVASVVHPPLKPFLIDRYIIAAIKGNMTPIVVINKIDLLEKNLFSKKEQEKALYLELVDAYQKANIMTLSVSCKTKKNIDHLQKLMQNKASVFSGQSGTGKSSLINETTKKTLITGEIVKKTKKGAHITTRASLIPLENGGFCIDTPGIKSFGLWDLKKEEIKDYFFEFATYANNCKFSNCMHINEPGCAVIQAVLDNKISCLRFDSYRSLIEDSTKKR